MFTHPKPVVPAIVRELNSQDRRFDRAMATDGVGGLLEATRAMIDMVGRKLTPAEQAQIAQYNREVDAYNAKVDAYNAGIRKARQTRANAREVAATRRAACTSCFTIHAGECA